MAALGVPAKRVTAPLGEDAKARLRGGGHWITCGYASSGCEHDALSSLLHAFFECDDRDSPSPPVEELDDEKTDSDGGDRPAQQAAALVRELVSGWRKGEESSSASSSFSSSCFRGRLISDVSAVAEALAALRPSGSAFRRSAMARLREMGYNAGVCKSRWESSRNIVAGSYEYIDVVVASGAEGAKERRYIVDLSFASQFEVARAEEMYAEVVAALPEVAVARPEEVQQVVRTVGKAARRSLKAQGLHVPPWLKERYMVAKWLGPYRRTTAAVPGDPMTEAVGFTAATRPATFSGKYVKG